MGCGHSSEDDRNAAGLLDHAGAEAETAAAFMSQADGLMSHVELALAASDLPDVDTFSKSDPFCVVYLKRGAPGQETWSEVARTEILANNLSPQWVTHARLTFAFEEIQHVRFEVYDVESSFSSNDSSGLDLSRQQLLGSVETTLANVFGTHNKTWSSPLRAPSGAAAGSLSVVAEEMGESNALVQAQFYAQNLPRVGVSGTPNAFYVLSKLREDGAWVPVYKSEVRRSSSPAFSRMEGTTTAIANCDMYRRLRVEVKTWSASGTSPTMGACETSLNDLHQLSSVAEPAARSLQLKNAQGKDAGELMLRSFAITPRPSFLDFIRGGTELNFIVAVDLTASNGPPESHDSLHHIDPTGRSLNPYAQAISAVGKVIEFYDSDKLFPLYGFGAKTRTQPGPPSHCFALNGDESAPEAQGVQGILETYYQSLQMVQLAGPTIFTNVISQAAAIAASHNQSESEQNYFVLLIITDGVINDMDNTIDAIINASGLPLSILIVGVGNADFAAMDALDSDDELLPSRSTPGRRAERDIVQFVPMNEFQGSGAAVGHALAKELLAEIPGQLTSYYRSINVGPMRAVSHAPNPTAAAASAPMGGIGMRQPSAPQLPR